WRERSADGSSNRMRMLASSTALAAISTLAHGLPVSAQTSWTGTASTDWFTAGNWTNGVPTAGTTTAIHTITPNPTVVGAPGATAGLLLIGDAATGQLTIANGGTVSNSISEIGSFAGSQGTVTVTGTGSTWISSGRLNVGVEGTGTLTIADG